MWKEGFSSSGTTNGASHGAADGVPNGADRARRPVLDRSEPRRGWSNVYAPGRADDAPVRAASEAAAERATPGAFSAEPLQQETRIPAVTDAASRVIREGYRIVEDNLRRGRAAAAELRGAGREITDFAARAQPQQFATEFGRALFDPALTRQVQELARSWLDVLGAAIPLRGSGSAPVSSAESVPRPGPLHPQERPGYARPEAKPQLLKLRSIGPGEWLGDMELEGEVRRVQIRVVDGEL